MAGVRLEMLLLLVLTGALLLVPVHSAVWEHIDGTELINSYEKEQWGGAQTDTSKDDSSDFDSDDAFPEVEGDSSSENIDPFADHGSQVHTNAPPRNWASGAEGGFQVEFEDDPPTNWDRGTDYEFQMGSEDAPPRSWTSSTDDDDDGGDDDQMGFVDAPPRSWTGSTDDDYDDDQMGFVDAPPRSWTSSISPSSSGIDVVCREHGFQITLLTGSLSDVKVLGSKDVPVMDAPDSCGYEVDSFQNILNVPFTGCNVKHTDSYSLDLLYVNEFGQRQVGTASCEESPKFDGGLSPHSSGTPKFKSKCSTTPSPPTKPSNCAVTSAERVPCGQSGISSSDCEKLGCCMASSACYYPLDECTGDQHFVFAIRSNSASIPVDPTKLVIPGNPSCKPVIVNDKVAIFKFKVTECGARAYEVGDTKIYLAEVQSVVKALNLKYGVITRTDPLRFMVECRYSKSGGSAQPSLASVGYMVKTPDTGLPSSVLSKGRYDVQLRLAKDQTYSSYWPNNHQPLRLLLGKPVYLELFLRSPVPVGVILVNYCLAYPRSAKNALVLIYEGCANPYDQNVFILKNIGTRNKRRFKVDAFQFMDQKTNKYLDEEIYFMCSTEVCFPREKSCPERCFDGKAP